MERAASVPRESFPANLPERQQIPQFQVRREPFLGAARVAMPGMPAEMAARMKSSIAGDKSYESCLTEEQAKRPTEDFFAGKNNQCRYDHFTMGDGKIDAKMRCAQGGMSQVMEMAGTYSPDSYKMRMTTATEGAGGAAEGAWARATPAAASAPTAARNAPTTCSFSVGRIEQVQ